MRRLVCLLVLLSGARVAADTSRGGLPPLSAPGAERRLQAAMALYERGNALSKRGQTGQGLALFERAAAELDELTKIEPRAWVYYALGQAQRRRGDCDRAVAAYRRALDALSNEPLSDAAKAEFASRTKQQIGGCVVEHPQSEPPPPQAPVPAPIPQPSPVPPPTGTFAPAPRSELVATPMRTRYSVAAPATLAAVAIVAIVAGGALYGVSGQRYDDLVDSGCGHQMMCLSDRYGATQRMERAGIGLMIAGGVVAVVDVALWAGWRRAATQRAAASRLVAGATW